MNSHRALAAAVLSSTIVSSLLVAGLFLLA
jgi:hypothetical protein